MLWLSQPVPALPAPKVPLVLPVPLVRLALLALPAPKVLLAPLAKLALLALLVKVAQWVTSPVLNVTTTPISSLASKPPGMSPCMVWVKPTCEEPGPAAQAVTPVEASAPWWLRA